jgi:NAD/NADP transhydrogenase alpha subunit
MFTRFARPIDLRNVRTPRPLGVGIGSIGFPDDTLGFPDNGLGSIWDLLTPKQKAAVQTGTALTAEQKGQAEAQAAAEAKEKAEYEAYLKQQQASPSMTGQDWASIIGASTAGLMNLAASIANVAGAKQASAERERTLRNLITAGGTVTPAAGVGIGMGTLALIAGAGVVIYMLVRRKGQAK